MSSPASSKRKNLIRELSVNGVLFLLILLWTIPTIGLLVSSFRTRFDIQTSGWWQIFPHKEWMIVEKYDIPEGLEPDGIMEIEGVSGTFEEFREGIDTSDGKRVFWSGNKSLATIKVKEQKWQWFPKLTLENYGQVLAGKSYEIETASGDTMTVQGANFTGAFLNSLIVAVPATIIPILIAAFAAYGFAWMNFFGRKFLFTIVVALLVIPLQISLVPILKDYVKIDLNGTYLGVWLAHSGFGLSLATYLLFNYIKGLPRDILESAFIDGASHFTIFTRLILPLSVPALASFAIFQFLWVWNDYLIALVFIGAKPDVQVLTMRIAEMVGSRGADWQVLTAGAFVSMILPLAVFFSLQRFFVRGLLAGSVKG